MLIESVVCLRALVKRPHEKQIQRIFFYPLEIQFVMQQYRTIISYPQQVIVYFELTNRSTGEAGFVELLAICFGCIVLTLLICQISHFTIQEPFFPIDDALVGIRFFKPVNNFSTLFSRIPSLRQFFIFYVIHHQVSQRV